MLKSLSVLMLMLPMGSIMLGAGVEPEEQAPVKLEYTFQVGEPVRYKAHNLANITQVFFDQISTSSEEMNSVISRELIETLDDGTLVIAEQTEQYKYRKTTSDDGEFVFDSTNPDDQSKRDDERIRATMTGLDWVVQLLMSPQGEITGLANEKALIARTQEIENAELRAEVLDELSFANQLKEINPFTKLLPEQAVGVGDTWDVSYRIDESPMIFKVEQTMTVTGIIDWKEGKYVSVDVVGIINFDLPPDSPEFMKITANSIKGQFVFNTHLGTVTDYESTLTIGFGGSPSEDSPGVLISSTLSTSYEMIRD